MKRITPALIMVLVIWFLLRVALDFSEEKIHLIKTSEEQQILLERTKSEHYICYFDTVVEGTTIERFYFEIKGIAKGLYGELIIFIMKNSIIAGMSGSPCYIKGDKTYLLGSLSYALNNPRSGETYFGGITPFYLMKAEADKALNKETSINIFPKSVSYQGLILEQIPLGNISLLSQESRKIELLNPVLKNRKFVITSNNGGSSSPQAKNHNFPELKAGMPILVDLIEWTTKDCTKTIVSALGTITYIDPQTGRIYAFGHPFLDVKKACYYFRTCFIIGTPVSYDGSYKIYGEFSETLGTIDLDSTYGVYGFISSGKENQLPTFNIEFSKENYSTKEKEITNKIILKLANVDSLIPSILEGVLNLIGEVNEAPLSTALSTTELSAKINLENYPPIETKHTSSQKQVVFGTKIIPISSFSEAVRRFISKVYAPILLSNYNFNITGVEISVHFIPREMKKLTLENYEFPQKIKYGENPVLLGIKFVPNDNSFTAFQNIEINIDWKKVKKPVYRRNDSDSDKENEKIVNGSLYLFGVGFYESHLLDSEREIEFPSYFLNQGEFLNYIIRMVQLNEKFFILLSLDPNSAYFDALANSIKQKIFTETQPQESKGWIIEKGVKERIFNIRNEGSVPFWQMLSDPPSGCVFDPFLKRQLNVEITID